MYTYLARLSLMLLLVGKDLAAEFTTRPPGVVVGPTEVLRLVSAIFIFFFGGEASPRLTLLLSVSLGITRGCPIFSLELDVMHNAHCCSD